MLIHPSTACKACVRRSAHHDPSHRISIRAAVCKNSCSERKASDALDGIDARI